MKLQPIDNLVDHLALGTHREADEIEIGARDRLHDLAVGGIMRGREHVLGVERRFDATRERAVQRPRQRGAVGAVDQDRLADQGQIARPRSVFVVVTDTFGEGCGDAAGEEAVGSREAKAAEVLVAIGHEADLGHDAADVAFATIGRRTLPVRSKAFRQYLVAEYMGRMNGRVPNSDAVSNGVNSLEALAVVKGEERVIFTRIGKHNGTLYLDLGDRADLADLVVDELQLTGDWVVRIVGGDELLSNKPVLQRAVKMRSPYVDALSLLQMRALRTLRTGDHDEADLPQWQRLLLLSVSGVSAGLQNTG